MTSHWRMIDVMLAYYQVLPFVIKEEVARIKQLILGLNVDQANRARLIVLINAGWSILRKNPCFRVNSFPHVVCKDFSFYLWESEANNHSPTRFPTDFLYFSYFRRLIIRFAINSFFCSQYIHHNKNLQPFIFEGYREDNHITPKKRKAYEAGFEFSLTIVWTVWYQARILANHE